MAYIGRQLVRGQNRIYDDISSSFNGSTTAFNLTIGGDATPPAQVNQLWIVLGGILQKPGTDFTVADAQVTFTTAPASGLDFWAMIQGDTSDMNAPSDGSVTPTKIATSGDFAFPADIRLKDADGSHYVGVQAPTTVSSNLVWTLPATDGSANQYLKTDGSGTLSWASDTATDATKMPLAGGTFTGDVTFDGATAGRDIIWDKSDNALEFADSTEAQFGAGTDLQIYSNGTDGILKAAVGELYLQSDSSIRFTKEAAAETLAKFIADGACELYHNDSKKFETTAAGATVTGTLTATLGTAAQTSITSVGTLTGLSVSGDFTLDNGTNAGNDLYWDASEDHLVFKDNVYAKWGTGGDLAIYHNGSHSYINDNGTGILAIRSNGTEIALAKTDGESMARFITDGAVELYHDNSKKFETLSAGVTVTGYLNMADDSTSTGGDIYIPDVGILNIGTGNDLKLYHNGTDSYVKNATGDLYIDTDGDDLYLQAQDDILIRPQNGQNGIKVIGQGSVELYNNDVKTIETGTGSATLFGVEGGEARLFLYADEGDDNADKWRLEADTSGSFNIHNLSSGSWERSIACAGNGNVELFHDDSKKFETTSSGCKITGGGGNGLQIENSGGTNAACIDLKNSLSSYVKEYRLAVAGSDGAYAAASALFIRDQTAGATRLELNTSGDVKVSSGDITFGTAGKGVVLGSTSNVDSNTLDDYEEGTFTPTWGDANTTAAASGITYAQQSAYYTKIGRVVHISIWINHTANTNTSTGNLILNLPFTSNSVSGYRGGMTYTCSGLNAHDDWDDSDDWINRTHINTNASWMEVGFGSNLNGGTWATSALRVAGIANGSGGIQLEGVYMAS